MTGTESALLFGCAGETLVGILHRPHGIIARLGLLILVGGPQYRVGANRQYVHLARAAASAGFAALRFDYRGIGDSGGVYPGLDGVQPDIAAAIAAFRAACPSVTHVVAWGLCEAASAILIHGAGLPDIAGGVLANPWLADDAAQARGMIHQHYGRRLLAGQFWRRLLTGKVSLSAAALGLWRTMARSRTQGSDDSLGNRMAAGLAKTNAPFICLLSQQDDTAQAFRLALAHNGQWRRATSKQALRCIDIHQADHVFADPRWRQQVADATIAFLRQISDTNS